MVSFFGGEKIGDVSGESIPPCVQPCVALGSIDDHNMTNRRGTAALLPWCLPCDIRRWWFRNQANQLIGTRWAPTSYKWSYNPYKWPYDWVTGVITPVIGVITQVKKMVGGPPCSVCSLSHYFIGLCTSQGHAWNFKHILDVLLVLRINGLCHPVV